MTRRLPALLLLALAVALSALPATDSIQASASQTVPADWQYVPDGIEPGDSFRLLFVTSATRGASSSNIADYNAFVQNAAGGDDSLKPYKDGFTALISTASVDAKTNTGTTGTGVPVHWLGGAKVADDYADLYDTDWDSVSGKTETGSAYSGLVWTGGNKQGGKSGQRYAGAGEVRMGDLSDATTPLSSPTAKAATESYPLYALSPVFTVAHPSTGSGRTDGDESEGSGRTDGDESEGSGRTDGDEPRITNGPAIVSSPASGDTYGRGESIVVAVTFSEAVTVSGEPRVRIALGERTRWALYDHSRQDGTVLVFAYTVRANNRDGDGVSIPENGLGLNRGSITDADGNAAVLDHAALAAQAGHKVDGSQEAAPANSEPVDPQGDPEQEPVPPAPTPTPERQSTPVVGNAAGGPGGPFSVPPSWAHIPKNSSNNPIFTDGQSFRLIYLTSSIAATSASISTYDTRSQTDAGANQHLKPIRNSIQAVISTSAVDARDHTGTAPANGSTYASGEGVPIYWLNGAKVADDYADFWDNSWDSTAGRFYNDVAAHAGQTFVFTGSNANGTKHATNHAGTSAAVVAAGIIGGGTNQPISGTERTKTQSNSLYGLTQVITVDAGRPVKPSGLTAHPHSADSVVLGWDRPSDPTITKYQQRHKQGSGAYGAWTDIANTGKDSFFGVVSGLSAASYTFQVRAVDGLGAGPASDGRTAAPDAGGAVDCEAITTTGQECTVPADWPLVPDDVGPGDSFRLMFVTSGTIEAGSREIADYNTHVQDHADDNPFLKSFKGTFRALASAWDVNARPNTFTRNGDSHYSQNDKGKDDPIYWLAGPKVGDDYADLFDGSWDYNSVSGAYPTDELGRWLTKAGHADRAIWTGSESNGINAVGTQLGDTSAIYGYLNGAVGTEIRACSPGCNGAVTDSRRLYAMSPVLTVEDVPVITERYIDLAPAGDADTYVAGDDIVVFFAFSKVIQVTGTPTLKIMVGANERTASCVRAMYAGEPRGLSCSYEVVAGDRDTDGITVAAGKLAGTIKDTGNNDAVLTYTALPANNEYKVDGTKRLVWSATLTADDADGFFGCDNQDNDQDNCSSSSVLTDDDFDYGGTTYTVDAFYWENINELSMGFASLTGPQAKSRLSALTLTVEGSAFAVSAGATDSDYVSWPYTPATAWTDGRTVLLALTGPVDTTGPSITGIAISSAPPAAQAGHYKAGDDIVVDVSFNEVIQVTGAPELKINVGSAEKTAACARKTGDTAKLACTYRVAAGDTDDNGISVERNKLSLPAGASIKDGSNNNATLTYRASIALGNQARHKVDTSAPQITFPTDAPVVGSSYDITAADAIAKVKKLGAMVVDGSSGTAADCDTSAKVRNGGFIQEWTDARTPASRSYTIPAGSSGKKVCAYAEDAAGNSHSALWDTAIIATLPAVAGLAATPSNSQVVLAWTNPADCTTTAPACSYQYRYRVKAGGAWSAWTAPQPASLTTARAIGLAPATEYELEVRRRQGGATLAQSSVTATTTGPAKPADLTATGVVGGVTLSWTDPADSSITKWQYRLGLSRGGPIGFGSWTDMAAAAVTTASGKKSYTVTSLQVLSAGTDYGFQVRAMAGALRGGVSDTVEAGPLPPDLPITATPGAYQVTLGWTDPATCSAPLCEYDVRYRVKDGAWSDWTTADTRTSHTVTALTPSTEYEFTVRRTRTPNTLARGAVSATTTAAMAGAVPTKPTGVTASARDRRVDLTWRDPGDPSITRWEFRYKLSVGAYGAWQSVNVPGGSALGLTNGTSYTFQVRAVNANGNSPNSDEVSATPRPDPAPAKPTGLSGSAGQNRVTLTWRNPGDTSITKWQYTQDGGTTWQDVPGSGPSTTRYTVTGLTNGTAYTFRVRAVNAVGNGASSDAVSVTPSAAAAPAQPQGLTAVAGSAQALLRWTDPGDPGITRWQYTQDRGTTWQDVPGSGPSTTRHTVTGLTNGTAYTFRVRAVNANGNSAASAPATVTPSAATRATITGVEIVSTPRRDNTYAYGETISIEVTFSSERISASGIPVLVLNVGVDSENNDIVRYVNLSRVSGNKAVFNYEVVFGDKDVDGVSLDRNAVYLPTFDDDIFDPENLQSAYIDYAAVSDDAEHKVDGMKYIPEAYRSQFEADATSTTTNIVVASLPNSGDTYRRGEDIRFSVDLQGGAVYVDGAPTLRFNMGGETREARYSFSRSSGKTTSLIFIYEVRNGDMDADGISVPANPLQTNEAHRIYNFYKRDPAIMTHAGLSDQAAHKVDVPDLVQGFTATPGSDSVTLSWTDATTCGTGCEYQFRYRAPGDNPYERWWDAQEGAWSAWTTLTSPHTVSGLSANTWYDFELRRRVTESGATTTKAEARDRVIIATSDKDWYWEVYNPYQHKAGEPVPNPATWQGAMSCTVRCSDASALWNRQWQEWQSR